MPPKKKSWRWRPLFTAVILIVGALIATQELIRILEQRAGSAQAKKDAAVIAKQRQ